MALKFVVIGLLLTLGSFPSLYTVAFAQSVPLPAPAQGETSLISRITENFGLRPNDGQDDSGSPVIDKTRPTIQIITKELFEGKNVVKVKILDDSPISSRYTKYISDGTVVYGNLVKAEGDEYKTLVDVKGPNAVMVFEAVDQYGNKAVEAKVFDVKPAGSWLDSMMRWLQNLFPSA